MGGGKEKSAEEFIKPAVDGTVAIMKACHKNKVKRIVITASMASIIATDNNKQNHFTEADFSKPENTGDPYTKSKAIAEMAAWNYVKALPEAEKFEIVTIHPGLVSGASFKKQQHVSADVFKGIMLDEFKMLPDHDLPVVHIDDVAMAHLQGIKVQAAAGRRFILCAESTQALQFGKWMAEMYPDYKPTTKMMPVCLVYMAMCCCYCSKNVRDFSAKWGLRTTYDTKPVKDILGIDMIQGKQCVKDMCDWLISSNYLVDYAKDKKK